MKKYTYTGKHLHQATLRFIETDAEGKKTSKLLNVSLSKGSSADLPQDNEHVKSMVAAGLLVEENPISKK
jgi:type VI protein secretion system component Hcp